MTMLQIIEKKKLGKELTKEEIFTGETPEGAGADFRTLFDKVMKKMNAKKQADNDEE